MTTSIFIVSMIILGLKFPLTGIEREHFRERFGKLQKLWVCGGVSIYILMIVFRLQSYTAIELLRDLNLLDSQPSTLDFKINMGLERIDLYVGSEIFIEIDRMSGRFLYKNKSETPEADVEDVSLIDDVSSPVVEGDCQKISKDEVRTILTEQSQRYEGVIETIEETRKF